MLVDVLVVSYNSRDRLSGCVEPLATLEDTKVIVVDNASVDGSLRTIDHLPVTRVTLPTNRGFAAGVNEAARAGSARYVLLLNPDARIDRASLDRLVASLEHEPSVGAAGPRIVALDGSLEYSIRRFPTLCTTYAQALFLHRIFRKAAWSDEIVRDAETYHHCVDVDWLSGACLLVRRSLFEQLGGLDERFFLYCEDVDLCFRIRAAGMAVRFVPDACCVHEGGASSAIGATLPLLAASRLAYARKHRGRWGAGAERVGIALGALSHSLLSTAGRRTRASHLTALRCVLFARSSQTAAIDEPKLRGQAT